VDSKVSPSSAPFVVTEPQASIMGQQAVMDVKASSDGVLGRTTSTHVVFLVIVWSTKTNEINVGTAGSRNASGQG